MIPKGNGPRLFAYISALTRVFSTFLFARNHGSRVGFGCYFDRQSVALVADTLSLAGRKTGVGSRKDQARGLLMGEKGPLWAIFQGEPPSPATHTFSWLSHTQKSQGALKLQS